MAKEDCDKKGIKLIHLFWTIIVAATLAGVAWGIMKNQQGTNTDKIKELDTKKVEKEIFDMHQTQQNQQFDRIEGWMEKIEKKL